MWGWKKGVPLHKENLDFYNIFEKSYFFSSQDLHIRGLRHFNTQSRSFPQATNPKTSYTQAAFPQCRQCYSYVENWLNA
jgi:hypothetical protein